MASQPITCRDCGAEICSGRNRTGYCGRCVGKVNVNRPGVREKISRSMRMAFAMRPDYRAAAVKNLRQGHQSPAALAARKKRWATEKPWIKGNAARPAGSESRVLAGARASATKLAWCPPHLRDHYRFLTKTKRFLAAEARQMIEEQHEAELQRWRRSIGAVETPARQRATDFEGDEALLAAVGEEFDFTLDEMRAPGWHGALGEARRTFVHILSKQGRSYREIAALLHRKDHSTALDMHRHFIRKATPYMRQVAADFLAGDA